MSGGTPFDINRPRKLTNAAAIEEHGTVIPLVEFGKEACQCYEEHTVQKSLVNPGQ